MKTRNLIAQLSALGLALMALSSVSHAGTTGAVLLLTPQAGGAGTANGDYVSDAAGLNSPYHFFIEVPPGLGRLVVEVFDDDVVRGGAAEATAGRDRDRGNGGTAVYNLIRPDGSTAAGPITGSAGAGTDNAWVAILNSATAQNTAAGHWELRVDMTTGGNNEDAINAIGVRANDGTAGGGGTELNVYADSSIPLGVNPPNAGTASRTYTFYPYITSGCTCSHNDFDYDSDAGNTGSVNYTSRSGTFTQNFASAALSANNAWKRDNIAGWSSDSVSEGDGIWTQSATINSYTNGAGINGNYTVIYLGNFQAAANPPAANPSANSFRIYFPTDAGTAPVKPYLEQDLTHFQGPNPAAVGQAVVDTVTVRLVNPTAQAITFSATHLVTANIPGPAVNVKYAGSAQVSQGTVTAQPAVGGTGNVTWNPGTLAAGATAILAYNVTVTATSAGQRIPVTAIPASGNGTRATWVDETGNATQTRATFTFGPLCELAATQGLLTEAVISSFNAEVQRGETAVEWTTASEAGTVGFRLYRLDPDTHGFKQINSGMLPANVGAPAGGHYRFVDSQNIDSNPIYVIDEITAKGTTNRYGPFSANGEPVSEPVTNAQFEHSPRAAKVTSSDPVRKTAPAFSTDSIFTPPEVDAATAKVVAAMVGVPATGIVRVAAADLASTLGVTTAAVQNRIRSGQILITSLGLPVAWTATAAGDAILFFGQKTTSIYSNDRVYRIELQKGNPMGVVAVNSSSPATTTFVSTHLNEVDSFPAVVLPLDPESDYWFWDFIISGDPTYGEKQFPLDAPAMSSASGAVLQVRLQGALSGLNHDARVSLNGVPIGDVFWSSLDAATSSLTIPDGILHAGANQVTIDGVLQGDETSDIFYVNNFQIRYQRSAVPDSGLLQMPVTPGTAVTAGPFANGPMVLDVTNPLRPSLLQGGSRTAGNVSFIAPPRATSLFFSDTASFIAPSFLRSSYDATLTSRSNKADYVVIAPLALHAAASSLAQFRQGDGLQTYVADLEQIYDEFSGGNSTPHAIHDFISATASWSRAPKYFVLAGGGTLDYRGIDDPPGLIPPIMTKTTNGIYASDSLFADRNGDGLPDVAIGRIPINSAAELNGYIAKLTHSASASVASSSIVFSADAVDNATDFRTLSQQSEAALSARPSTRIYMDNLGAAGARTALLNSWSAGTPLLSWVGHGGLDQLASSAILTDDDAPALTSSGTLPFFIAMTCVINRFEIGGSIEALGSALTRTPGAGALAVWSASGLSSTAQAPDLERTFTILAAKSPTARIGDLIVQSFAANKSIGETGSVYLLLGDPAIRLSLPPFIPSRGTPSLTRE